jgi:hypothetical protein
MKHLLLMLLVLSMASPLLLAQNTEDQQGTIVRMRMSECMPQHSFMKNMSGAEGIGNATQCPEYLLMSDMVVYAISGKNSNQLLPLAEVTRFRLKDGEILIRLEDERKESRFRVKAMMLRSDWERERTNEELHMAAAQSQDGPPISVSQR